eukprot:scaffold3586_cov164-Amphora_coffeaeformis.AAC.3
MFEEVNTTTFKTMNEDNQITTTTATQSQQQQQQNIILFYRYHPLTSDPTQIEVYRAALEQLCTSLHLRGRILVGASKTEGINGTLAGVIDCVRAFTWALLGKDHPAVVAVWATQEDDVGSPMRQAVERFWKASQAFFQSIGQTDELRMQSPEDFKWSVASPDSDPLFPDLRIVVRKELIGSGGMADISIAETAQGYLTPSEWHERLAKATQENDSKNSTVVIDCRNTKEFEIGRFQGALDPHTTTFSQFPQWVHHNKALLANKEVLMYCTGGIRCEKASAFIRQAVPEVKQVNHLKGGIHKYLESYGSSKDSLWHGKNFVFDGRQAVSAEETQLGKDGADGDAVPAATSAVSIPLQEIVGRCVYCESPFDQFEPKCVCAVCREPLLACTSCQNQPEFHCRQHIHLRNCYFANLERFSAHELLEQKQLLETFLAEIAVGRKFKQKRKTLIKQCQRIAERLQESPSTDSAKEASSALTCRNCGQSNCSGKCWGFFGLKRKEVLEAIQKEMTVHNKSMPTGWSNLLQKPKRQRQQNQERPEIERLGLFRSCSEFRDPDTGIRVPPCMTRELKCHTKGKWCGRPVIDVVQEEFKELSHPERLQESLHHGLLRLNGKPLKTSNVAEIKLKSSDVLSRVLHWHEAPVLVPEAIGVDKVPLPTPVLDSYGLEPDDASIYVCDKPSSVPVHPAGPYYANVLTFMAEAQLGLSPLSLHPVHRTDRVTSGLTLCCTNPKVARIFHTSLSEGLVRKMYIAKVKGRFPSSKKELHEVKQGVEWSEKTNSVEVLAPVLTSDPANGIRIISDEGKESRSRFGLVYYDPESDSSILNCFPITGRNHQLRLHLAHVGFPILQDEQYGGEDAMTRDTNKSDAAIQLMRKALAYGNRQNETQALKACSVCNDENKGIEKSFTPAQLLEKGHGIMLHAYRYEVTFAKQQKEIASAEYSVGLPNWFDPQYTERLVWLS